MKTLEITRLELVGFGKFRERTIDLTSGLNLIDRFSVRRGIRKQRTDETGGKQHLYHYPVQCGHYGGFIG